jgi:hypothetical protein
MTQPREPGYYWITLDEEAVPEIAHWDGKRWFAVGCEHPIEPLRVVSERLSPPATRPDVERGESS